MSDTSLRRISKADVIRLLNESRAREESLRLELVPLHKLEEELARKTSDLELSMRRELELRKGNESLVNQRTQALNEASRLREASYAYQKTIDQEKALREQMEQRLADMRLMVDVVKMVASRE